MEVVEEDIKPGYKLTKLGWIPEDWGISSLGEAAKIMAGGTPNRKVPNYWNGKIPWVTTSLIRFNRIKGAEEFISELGLKNSAAKIFPKGTVLIALYGLGVTRGKSAILDCDAATNQACAAFLPYQTLDNEYLFYFLHNKYFSIRRLSNIGGQDNLSGSILRTFPILLPKLEEQKAIAQILTTWDTAIEKLTQLIALKQQKKKALMQALLTGKKRFLGFEGEWREYRYKDLLKVVKRPVKWNDEELYQLISVRRRSGGLFERENLYGHQILTKDLRIAREGDFLISKMQVLHGASGLVTKEFDGKKISGSYIAVVAKDKNILDISFLNWYSKMPFFYHQTYVSSYGVHIEKMTFDFSSFLKLVIKLPPFEEQKKIVKTLEFADKEILILRKKLDRLNDQKKGLMQQLLTGKKRIEI